MSSSPDPFPSVAIIVTALLSLVGTACPADPVDASDASDAADGEQAESSSTGGTTPDQPSTTSPPGTSSDPAGESSSGADDDGASGPADTGNDPGSSGSDEDTGGTPPDGTCPSEALDTPTFSVEGNNTTTADDVTLSCSSGGGGNDMTFSFTTGPAGLYRFQVTSDFTPTLALLDGCDGAEIACSAADKFSEFDIVPTITRELPGSTDYVVAIDSASGDVGEFLLEGGLLENAEALPSDFCENFGGASCDMEGPGVSAVSGTLGCDVESGEFGYLDIYEVDVNAGDCIYASVDNIDATAGATGVEAASISLVLYESAGIRPFFDNVPCTDPSTTGSCAEGGMTAAESGSIRVVVYGSTPAGCMDSFPYTLSVAVNGTDVDLSGGPVVEDVYGVCIY